MKSLYLVKEGKSFLDIWIEENSAEEIIEASNSLVVL